MTTVVGIDSSLTAAGVAAINDPKTASTPNIPRLRTVGESGSENLTVVARAKRIRRQRDRILKAMPPTTCLVVIEALPPRQPPASSFYVERGALILELAEFLGTRRIPVIEVAVTTLKMFATGSGAAGKPQMVSAMRDLWPGAPLNGDDNLADALAAATLGSMHLGWYQPEATHHWAPKVDWTGLTQ